MGGSRGSLEMVALVGALTVPQDKAANSVDFAQMPAKNCHNIEEPDWWAELSVYHKTHKVEDSRGLQVMVVVKYRNILAFLRMKVNWEG